MNRTLTAVLALTLAAAPLVSAAQSDSMKPASGAPMGSMSGSMNGMAMPATSVKHDVMTLGALPASLQGKPVVVRIHADWCPACKATHAIYDAVQKQFADKVTFVTFDVTDGKTAAAAAAKAEELGLGKLFDADKTATSTVAVINPKTGVVATSLYNDNSADDYAKAIGAVSGQLTKS